MAWPKGKPRGPRKPVEPGMEAAPPSFSKPSRWTMKAGANWETATDETEDVDKLAIPKDMIPEGMDMQWVTHSVLGQEMPQQRRRFEIKGWTPVHPEDFDGRFNGRWTPKGDRGEINYNGLVLMARPKELSSRAKARDRAAALEQIAIKEAALKGGALDGVTLDAGHSSARQFNHINRTIERIEIPKE